MRPVSTARAFPLFAALVLFALLVGCSTGKITTGPAPTPSTVTSPPAASASNPASPTTAAPRAQVGDTLNLAGTDSGSRMAVTVTRVVDPATAADEFSTPSPGNRLVSVQFRLKNIGTTVYSDAPSNGAEAIDSNGQGYSAWIAGSAAGPSFPGIVHLAPDDTALGYVTLQVPNGAKVAKVQFTLSSGLADDTGEWIVNSSAAQAAPPAGQPPATSTAAPADPRQVVENYFADINARDYNGAWALGGKNLDSSLQNFTAGFSATQHDSVTVTGASGGTVSVDLDALQTDGSHRHFSGTYTVQDGVIVNANIQ
jgi:hypothetical protein